MRIAIHHKRSLKIAVVVLVVVAWCVFLAQRLQDLRQYSWQVAPLAIVLSICSSTVYFGGLAYCWGMVMHRTRGAAPDLPRMVAARIWLYSMMSRYIPGNVWHILGRVVLAREKGVSAGTILSSAVGEQILTLLGMLGVFVLSLPFWDTLPIEYRWFIVFVPVGLGTLHPRVLGRILTLLASRLQRPELAWRYTYRDIVYCLVLYLGMALCAGIALVLLLNGLAPVAWKDVPIIIGAAGLAWSVGYVSLFTPSGIGVREATLTALLATIYPLPIAIVASLLYRLTITLGEVLAVCIAWASERFCKPAQV